MDTLPSLIAFLVTLVFVGNTEGFFINIDAHAEECFFDKVSSGTKMSLMFEVAEGGFLDIDVKVSDQLGDCLPVPETLNIFLMGLISCYR